MHICLRRFDSNSLLQLNLIFMQLGLCNEFSFFFSSMIFFLFLFFFVNKPILKIRLWEMLYRCVNGIYEDPYAEYPSLRTIGEALYKAVAEKGTRPTIPPTCPPPVAALIRRFGTKN